MVNMMIKNKQSINTTRADILKSRQSMLNLVSKADAEPLKDWTLDMEPQEEEATDKILEYLIQSGAQPNVDVKGDRLDIVIAITKTMRQTVPESYSEPLKIMNDYIARWICGYFEHANIQSMEVHFGFGSREKITMENNHGA